MIVCDGVDIPCTYDKLVELVKALITDMVILSTFLAVAVFAYAGFKMIMSRGSETEYKAAVKMFGKVLWGYLWILAAWLIVYTISSVLLNPGFSLLEAPR